MDNTLGPPACVGWYWCRDAEIVTGDPYVLAHWDGATLRLYTPDEKIREWPFAWDGEDWVCTSDDSYTEVDPIEWIPVEKPS